MVQKLDSNLNQKIGSIEHSLDQAVSQPLSNLSQNIQLLLERVGSLESNIEAQKAEIKSFSHSVPIEKTQTDQTSVPPRESVCECSRTPHKEVFQQSHFFPPKEAQVPYQPLGSSHVFDQWLSGFVQKLEPSSRALESNFPSFLSQSDPSAVQLPKDDIFLSSSDDMMNALSSAAMQAKSVQIPSESSVSASWFDDLSDDSSLFGFTNAKSIDTQDSDVFIFPDEQNESQLLSSLLSPIQPITRVRSSQIRAPVPGNQNRRKRKARKVSKLKRIAKTVFQEPTSAVLTRSQARRLGLESI
jgi:hypothetical protein